MVVVINFDPGPVYHLGESWVKVGKDPEPEPGAQDPKAPVEPPVVKDPAAKVLPPVDAPPPSTDLTKSGWVAGERALADQVLAMVENNVSVWTAKGYPKAKTIETHYFLDPDKKLLNAEVTLDPGYYALMGPLVVEGDGAVETAYIENLVTWQVGEVWDQRLLDRFVDAMFQTGLFKTVDPVIGEEDDYGHRPILVTLSATPFKTVSGSVNFDSDFGPGIILSWEHRNFTARGDRLRLEFPAWADLIQFGASYVRPYFLSPKQNLLLDFSAIHERAQAYALTAVSAAGGIERQLTRHLSGLFQLSLEAGRLEEDDKPQSEYTIYGLPSALSWDFSDDYLNPTKGSRVKISVEPYTGTYFDSFNVIKSRLDASHYFPITDAGRLVFAVRGAAGGIWGAERTSLPATLRFYGGGGGSMRGYEYQSVGPRNDRDEPDGGGAMAEVSGEVRVRFGESLGATVFVDGGMVYDRPDFDKIGQSFLWGGGLGFRYYTPIGPFRLDLATPLTPRKDDNPLQFYLSLGQSF
jgi:translocation and assembly module TamA